MLDFKEESPLETSYFNQQLLESDSKELLPVIRSATYQPYDGGLEFDNFEKPGISLLPSLAICIKKKTIWGKIYEFACLWSTQNVEVAGDLRNSDGGGAFYRCIKTVISTKQVQTDFVKEICPRRNGEIYFN